MRIDPGHQPRRAASGRRRKARQRIDQVEDVLVIEALEQADQAEDGVVVDLAEEAEAAFELPRLEPRDEADGAIEQPDEDEERAEPLVERDELRVAGMLAQRGVGLGAGIVRAAR